MVGSSLITIYDQLVQSGDVTRDAAQLAVIEKLDALRIAIKGYKLPRDVWFSRFMGKSSRVPSPQGMYIYGDVGRGKSMVMDLFFHAAEVSHKRRVHFHAFMLEVHERLFAMRAMGGKGDPIMPIADEIAAQSALLCFDEFHVTDIADAMLLGRLFSRLFELGVVVVATSNRPPDDLYKDGLQRERFVPFIDLLKTTLDIYALASVTDYRLKRMQAMRTVYFTPLGDEADRFMHDTFATLTQHAPIEENRLHIQGRELVLSHTAGDVVMVSFDALCKEALGSADYLEIAEEFTTVLLTDIPVLTPELRNEAKRFVTLIDALYEHKVKLICSAEVAPQELYTQGTGAFEFERTVSRLMEMQSEDYWKGAHQ